MTIAGSYELENTMGSQNEALPSQNFPFDKQYIRKWVFYTCLSNFMSMRFQKKTLGDSKWPFVTNDKYNAVILECFNVQS